MRLLYISAGLALFLSYIWYRRADAFRNFILEHPAPLPRAYVADGNYDSDCTTLRQYAQGPEAEKLQLCEDASFWEHRDADGIVVERPVILSCDAGRRKWNTVMGPLHDPEPKGSLWLYVPKPSVTDGRHKSALPSNISRSKAHPISLANYPPNHDFHPLGIAIWPSSGGNSSNLFVVNHARKRTVIEQFALNPEKPTEAVHIQTITSPYFVSPNALALTSPTSFYVTNDHLMTRRLPGVFGHILPEIESMLALPLAFVLHVDFSQRDSIPNIQFAKLFTSFPNGIALSPLGDEVAIASSSMGQVKVFRRDPVTNALTRKYIVSVPFLADNIHYKKEQDGPPSLIVGGHPNLSGLKKAATGQAGAAAPSWIVAVVPKAEGDTKPRTTFDSEAPTSAATRVKKDGVDWTLKTLFQSSGDEDKGGFGGSVTGLVDPDSGTLYVTGLYARDGAIMCQRPGLGRSKEA